MNTGSQNSPIDFQLILLQGPEGVIFSLIYLGLESAYAQKHMFCLGSYMVVHEHLSRVSGMHNLNALRTHALSQVLHLPSMTDPKPTGLLAFLEL